LVDACGWNKPGRALLLHVFQREGVSIMRTLLAVTSVVVLGFAGSVFAQANLGMDSSGRFDGSAPLGTGPKDEQSSGLSIPLDSFETGSTTTSAPIQWTRCPPQKRNGTNGKTANLACVNGR
jgi:hypothetical protein